MNVALYTSREPSDGLPPMHEMGEEWYGKSLAAPFRFSFSIEGHELVYRASCAAMPLVHPDAREGCFQENLWMYDAAEFFIAREDLSAYLECNVSPNGAWWSAPFSGPRVPLAGAAVPQLTARGEVTEAGWSCEGRLALADLEKLGIDLDTCRVAACAILQSPEQVFVTTGDDLSGVPDFHRLHGWGCFDHIS